VVQSEATASDLIIRWCPAVWFPTHVQEDAASVAQIAPIVSKRRGWFNSLPHYLDSAAFADHQLHLTFDPTALVATKVEVGIDQAINGARAPSFLPELGLGLPERFHYILKWACCFNRLLTDTVIE
jgi:hypothetical protein